MTNNQRLDLARKVQETIQNQGKKNQLAHRGHEINNELQKQERE